MTFRFRMLGGVSLEGPEGTVTGRATQRRRLAVLSLLSAAPEGVTARDRIVGVLWPDRDQAKARHLLSAAVYALRQALGEEAIRSVGDEELRLDGTVVWTDVAAFESSLESGELDEAVELYRGAFLEGFHVRDAPDFEHWREREARRLASRHALALEQLAERAEAAGDPKQAVHWWKRRAALDPHDSRVALALMRALADAGNPAGAIRHARVHQLLLRDELGLDPSPEVGELVRSLRAGAGGEAERTAPAEPSATKVEEDYAPPTRNPEPAVDRRSRRPARSLAVVGAGAAGVLLAVLLLLDPMGWRASGPGGASGSTAPLRLLPVTSLPGFERFPALSPDGRHIAFVWDGGPDTDQPDVYVMLADGSGSPTRITDTEEPEIYPAWSPDGTRIAFLRSIPDGPDELRMVGFPATRERLVGEVDNVMDLDWSPTEELLAVSIRPDGVVLMDPWTGHMRPLTAPPSTHWDDLVAFSPDGSAVAFTRRPNNSSLAAIHVQGLDWTEARQMTETLVIHSVEWSPDGREILTTRGLPGYQSLMRIPVDGGSPRTDLRDLGVEDVSVAPRAGVAVFTRRVSDHNIWRHPGPRSVGDGGWEPLVHFTREDSWAVYSPDGTRIAYHSNRRGDVEVWVADADGSNPLQITEMGFSVRPMWAPDGRRIVFFVPENHPAVGAHVVAAEGGPARQVFAGGVIPSWSRDGDWIYAQYKGDEDTWRIWRVPARGGEPERITQEPGLRPLEGPDGRVYFLGARPGRIRAIEPGQERAQSVLDPAVMSWPDWWLWEDQLVYASWEDSEGNPAIWMVDLENGDRRRLASLEGRRRADSRWGGLSVSPDGRWIVYTLLDRSELDLWRIEDFR